MEQGDTPIWEILLVCNLPVYLIVGKLLYRNWARFKADFNDLTNPSLWPYGWRQLFKGDYREAWELQLVTFRFGALILLSWIILVIEHSLIYKLFAE